MTVATKLTNILNVSVNTKFSGTHFPQLAQVSGMASSVMTPRSLFCSTCFDASTNQPRTISPSCSACHPSLGSSSILHYSTTFELSSRWRSVWCSQAFTLKIRRTDMTFWKSVICYSQGITKAISNPPTWNWSICDGLYFNSSNPDWH